MHSLGIDLALHQQGIDTTTPAGKAMFQMMGVFAEFERSNRGIPVALPVPVDPGPQGRKGKLGVPAQRPTAGPVVPLTGANVGSEELLGGRETRPASADPVAVRVLTTGEAVAAPTGRADDFRWPRGDITTDGAAPQSATTKK